MVARRRTQDAGRRPMARTAHRTPGPPAAGRPDPAATRAAIVAATVRLVGRGGTALVTHRAVAAEAGVSLSSTTYHFASKDAIVDAALRSVAEREIERLAAAAAQLQGPRRRPGGHRRHARLARGAAGRGRRRRAGRLPPAARDDAAARSSRRSTSPGRGRCSAWPKRSCARPGRPPPSWTRAWWPRRSTACASSSSRCRAGRTGSSPRDRCWSGSCAC